MEEQLKRFAVLKSDKKDDVILTNICEYSKGQLHEYNICSNYSDIVLLIAMLYDYIEMIKHLDGAMALYYRKQFEKIAEYLEEGIGYDYHEKLRECIEKKPEKDDRLGENWIGS